MFSTSHIDIPSWIPNIGRHLEPLEGPPSRTVAVTEEGHTAFDQFLQAAMNVVEEANVRLIDSDIAQVRFATGQDNDMLNVILAQERASSALTFTVNVSNTIIEAYREIMRMQI